MKKITLSLLLSCIILSIAYSQDTLKVTPGSFTTELNINPLKGELSLNNALNQIKVRYFAKENIALRLSLNLNSKKITVDNRTIYGTNPFSQEVVQKYSEIGTSLGIEKHFAGTRRLSPYIGAELLIAFKKSSQVTTNSVNEVRKIDGAWETFSVTNNNVYSTYSERAYVRYGMNVLTGFDFYIAKHFYLGYEINLTIGQTKYKPIVITTKPTNGNNPGTESEQKDFSIGLGIINGIRLGYSF